MVEQSKSSILRLWMRKVVGLNPGDELYRIVSFTFADSSIEKGDFEIKEKRQQCDSFID